MMQAHIWREGSLSCADSMGAHKIVYSEYGPANGVPVLCVHYLTGNGRYFDWLARDLAAHGLRVIAPDLPGRGRSDDLQNPDDYNFTQYLNDLNTLIAYLKIESCHWVGASLGGLLGIVAAATPGHQIKSLSLIDIGPFVPAKELQLIAAMIGDMPLFTDEKEAENMLRKSRAPSWGAVPEGYWPLFARYNIRARGDRRFVPAYDPAIAKAFDKGAINDVDLRTLWDEIQIKVTALRGAASTVFPREVADEMTRRGPGAVGNARVHEIAGCGHVPSMATESQIGIVRRAILGLKGV